MIRILFVIESLGAGGAERVLVNLVNQMDRARFDISILALFEEGVNAGGLKEDVELICPRCKKFRGMKTVLKFLPKRALYRKYVAPYAKGRYDLIVAYMTGVPTFIAAGAEQPKIAWLHGEFFPGRGVWGLKRIYDRFDAVAGVSDYVCGAFNRIVRSRNRAVTVYNTNDTDRIKTLSGDPFDWGFDGFRLATVGCLEKTKGFDRLIEACGRLQSDGFRFQLRILGEGVEREALQAQIGRLGLSNRVFLMGYCANPFPVIRQSDLFVCSSRTEGLSTAVSEAVILGVPVVSTDVSGAKEILGEGDEYGLVVKNSEAGLYEGLKKMLADGGLLARYREKSAERAAFFSAGPTVRRAEKMFEGVLR